MGAVLRCDDFTFWLSNFFGPVRKFLDTAENYAEIEEKKLEGWNRGMLGLDF
jgi:hypothetical protein